MLHLTDPIETIPYIGPRYKKLLEKFGIYTIQDMIFYFPTRHTDTSEISPLSALNVFEKKTVQVTIESIKNIRTRYGKFITEGKAYDTESHIDIIWFNQPYITRILKPGSIVLLNGKLNAKRNKPQLYSPLYEVLEKGDSVHLGRIVPLYTVTLGITAKWLRKRIQYLLTKHTYLLNDIQNVIPQSIEKRYDLLPLTQAIKVIHFPDDQKSLLESKKRLSFEELFEIQLKLTKNILKRQKAQGPEIKKFNSKIERFLETLQFRPTQAQLRSIGEILEDFSKTYPARRLLQGDVGCGKTLVAAAVSIPVIESGFQVALMAPTAILAKQHYESFQKFYKQFPYKIGLVTAITKQISHKTIRESNIIIGTHALLHRFPELFNNLGFVIIDEQHRFGVKQRELLAERKSTIQPHVLTMTATPIPRTIALSLFGDHDMSIIDEMPEGIIPTKTYFVPDKKRKESYKWIEKNISQKGNQAFWICPLIEESEKLEAKSVLTEFKKLKKIFPKLCIDVLHGKFSESEKNRKIQAMKKGHTQILVSTSVVEVGMDIPKANIIVIEGAERFGLAQLHQLRGRVGRRAHKESWCLLFTSENASVDIKKRLEFFARMNDGLKVAEYDLKTRGPGEVYGTKQAGIPDLKFARLTDLKLIKETREAALEYLKLKK